jgi:ribosomal protein L1
MNEDTFNMSLRKYLKRVGVTSQRELEAAVQQAIASGQLKGDESLRVKVTLSIDGLDLNHIIEGEIDLE